MINLINSLIQRAVDRILQTFTETERMEEVIDHAAQRLAGRFNNREVIVKLADHYGAAAIASEIGVEEVARNLDMQDIASEIDVYDIVNNLDIEEVASHIDMRELAGRVAELMPKEEVSPAPAEVPVSDPSLIERLLEKAVETLLEQAEEAARNGKV